MRSFAGELIRFRPGASLAILALMLVTGLTEGVSLAALVPLIGLVGLAPSAAGDGFGGKLAATLEAAGIGLGLPAILGLFLIAFTIRAAAVYLVARGAGALAHSYLHRLRARLHQALSEARWTGVLGLPEGRVGHALTEAPLEIVDGAMAFVRIVAGLVLVAIAFAVALAVAPIPALAALACGALLVPPAIAFLRATMKAARSGYARVDSLYQRIGAHLDTLKLLRFAGAGAKARARFEADSRADIAVRRRLVALHAGAALTVQLATAALLAALLAIGAGLGVSLAEAVVLAVIFARIMPRLQTVYADLRVFAQTAAAHQAHREMLARLQAEREPRADRPAPAAKPAASPPEIVLEEVSLAYPRPGGLSPAPALREVSLRLPAGRVTALVGRSGAGKTSLADVAAGLIAPGEGRLLVDGAPLEEAGLAAWRARVALVAQDEILPPGALRDALAFGRDPPPTDEEALQALEEVGLGPRLAGEPDPLGLDPGPGGRALSRGERQRVGIARALLQAPDFLVLDEATAALNPVDEAEITGRLARLRGSATVLVVAHRLASALRADLVAALEAGRVVETGAPAELLARPSSLLARMREAGGG